MIVRLLIIFIALLQAGCSAHLRRAKPLTTADDVAVYAVVLDSVFGWGYRPQNNQLVVVDSTTVLRREDLEDWFWTRLYELPEMDSATVADFQHRSRVAIPLRPLGDQLARALTRNQILLVPLERIENLQPIAADSVGTEGRPVFAADIYWNTFYRAFPNARASVSLSAVGYSRTRDRAVMYIEYGCASLCASADLVALQKDTAGWRIVGIRNLWVS